ncbi:uncharacterized protein LOC122168683 [Centrocercus urophasianus]|uniref:uncharacterized protein LOC122168683 n=1 Tax=Centrocercus urophasianus TaxID=9002 RepID=UPI001C645382|nr:uncharacterized protein LOC122168683 [Centrocercus urophasianus]
MLLLLLLLPLLALAEAWLHPFLSPWRLYLQQQQQAVLRTPAGSRLAVLAAFSLLLIHGHAQVLLQQSPPSVTRRRSRTVNIECQAEGIDDFQAAYIHWYRQLLARAPERLLFVIAKSNVSYDSETCKAKYLSAKIGNNICYLSVLNIHDDDEGTYYCAYWETHSRSSLWAAITESWLQSELHTLIQVPRNTAAFLPPSLSLQGVPTGLSRERNCRMSASFPLPTSSRPAPNVHFFAAGMAALKDWMQNDGSVTRKVAVGVCRTCPDVRSVVHAAVTETWRRSRADSLS